MSGRLEDDDTREFFSVSAATCGVLLGFLIAALAILTAVLDKQLIANMRKTGHYDGLVSRVKNVCGTLLFCVALSLVCQLFPGDARPAAAVALVFFETYSLAYVLSIGREFSSVIRHLK